MSFKWVIHKQCYHNFPILALINYLFCNSCTVFVCQVIPTRRLETEQHFQSCCNRYLSSSLGVCEQVDAYIRISYLSFSSHQQLQLLQNRCSGCICTRQYLATGALHLSRWIIILSRALFLSEKLQKTVKCSTAVRLKKSQYSFIFVIGVRKLSLLTWVQNFTNMKMFCTCRVKLLSTPLQQVCTYPCRG